MSTLLSPESLRALADEGTQSSYAAIALRECADLWEKAENDLANLRSRIEPFTAQIDGYWTFHHEHREPYWTWGYADSDVG